MQGKTKKHRVIDFSLDEIIAIRAVVDWVGSGVVIGDLSNTHAKADSQANKDASLTASLLGSASRKLHEIDLGF